MGLDLAAIWASTEYEAPTSDTPVFAPCVESCDYVILDPLAGRREGGLLCWELPNEIPWERVTRFVNKSGDARVEWDVRILTDQYPPLIQMPTSQAGVMVEELVVLDATASDGASLARVAVVGPEEVGADAEIDYVILDDQPLGELGSASSGDLFQERIIDLGSEGSPTRTLRIRGVAPGHGIRATSEHRAISVREDDEWSRSCCVPATEDYLDLQLRVEEQMLDLGTNRCLISVADADESDRPLAHLALRILRPAVLQARVIGAPNCDGPELVGEGGPIARSFWVANPGQQPLRLESSQGAVKVISSPFCFRAPEEEDSGTDAESVGANAVAMARLEFEGEDRLDEGERQVRAETEGADALLALEYSRDFEVVSSASLLELANEETDRLGSEEHGESVSRGTE